jgi:hypothetical protein
MAIKDLLVPGAPDDTEKTGAVKRVSQPLIDSELNWVERRQSDASAALHGTGVFAYEQA